MFFHQLIDLSLNCDHYGGTLFSERFYLRYLLTTDCYTIFALSSPCFKAICGHRDIAPPLVQGVYRELPITQVAVHYKISNYCHSLFVVSMS